MEHHGDLINIWIKSRLKTSACLLAKKKQGRLLKKWKLVKGEIDRLA